jgi:hypothetical protein
MKNNALLIRYRELQDYLHKLCQRQFSVSPNFAAEMIEHALSSEQLMQLLSNNQALEDQEESLKQALSEAKQWLSSLNFNFNTISLDEINESYGFEISDDDQLEETNEDLEDQSAEGDYVAKLIQEQKANDPEVQERLKLVDRLFPNGVEQLPDGKAVSELSDTEIVLFFKHHYLNLITDYPVYFFKNNTEHKIQLIVSYFQSQILQLPLAEFAKNFTIQKLVEHRMVSIARAVNYSWNNVLQIAFPNQFLPWLHGKVDQGYWENEEHRNTAIRWLIEDYFNIKPQHIWQLYTAKKYNRKLFGNLGLSYLYNQYFNSLLKPLEQAYPKLDYWHFGIYPDGYWEQPNAKENAVEAFRWMLTEEQISKKTLLTAIENKQLTRELFKKYNLSTMFDYIFNKNLYDLVNATFPNQFKPWEIGNVKHSFWQSEANKTEAVNWFIKESDSTKSHIIEEIESGKFQKKRFVSSKLANFFRHIFKNDPLKLFQFLTRQRAQINYENVRIVYLLKRRSKVANKKSLLSFILHGFNYPIYSYYEGEMKKRMERKLVRRKRILDRESK